MFGEANVSFNVLSEVPRAAEGTVTTDHRAHVRLGNVLVHEFVLNEVRLQFKSTLAVFKRAFVGSNVDL